MPLSKPVCKLCGKSTVKLTRHLHLVHNISLLTKEATNLKEFIQLCRMLPIPINIWTKLMEDNDRLDEYLNDKDILPIEVFQMLYTFFEKIPIQ